MLSKDIRFWLGFGIAVLIGLGFSIVIFLIFGKESTISNILAILTFCIFPLFYLAFSEHCDTKDKENQ